MRRSFSSRPSRAELGTGTDNKEPKVSAPKSQKNAPAGESGNQRPKRRKINDSSG